MRAEPESKGKDENGRNIMESDKCEFVTITKGQDGKVTEKVCGIRTSWKCDSCKLWNCHSHFRTYRGKDGEPKEICFTCEEKLLKARKWTL
jgi:hypothetical protein